MLKKVMTDAARGRDAALCEECDWHVVLQIGTTAFAVLQCKGTIELELLLGIFTIELQ